MTIHVCTRCPLRFTTRAEMADHMAHDHRVPEEMLQSVSYPGASEAAPLYRAFTADDDVHRILVIANQTLDADPLMDLLRERQEAYPKISVMVVVPATPTEHLATAPGGGGLTAAEKGLDARTDDAGLATARFRLRRAVAMLTDAGIVAHGRLGDPNPVRAAAPVMGEQAIDEIVLCTLHESLSRWLRADLPTSLRRHYDCPVTVLTVDLSEEEAGRAALDLRQESLDQSA